MASESVERFYGMISEFPDISVFWGGSSCTELDVEKFEDSLGYMSSGEVFLMKFFASVWFGNNSSYGFDVVDAVATLDGRGRGVIISWIENPFWP